MHYGFRRMLLACVVLCGTLACVSSHDVDGSGQALSGGSGGAGGQGGRSSAAAGTGGRAAGGAGRGGGAAAVSCGGATCAGTNIFGVALAGCCTEDDKCGVDLASVGFGACQEANAPGNANMACPSQTVAGILPLSGCCKPDGTCGALDNLFGLGCISLGTGAPSCTP
jgi:hypothetical protein